MIDDEQVPPDFETLVDWLDGLLTAASAVQIQEQVVRGDPELADTVKWLRTFMTDARRAALYDPPAILQQSVLQDFVRANSMGSLGRRPSVDRPETRLVYDSHREPVQGGVRGEDEDGGHRRLAYASPTADLVLDIAPMAGTMLRIDGQVLVRGREEAAVFEARANFPDVVVRDVDGDAHGRFHLLKVPRAAGELSVTNGRVELRVQVDLSGPYR